MQKNDPITVCAEPGYEAGARQLAETLCLDLSAEPAAGALRLTLGTDGLSLGDGTSACAAMFRHWRDAYSRGGCARNMSFAPSAEKARSAENA